MTFWRHPLTRSGGFVAVLAAVQLVALASHADTFQVTNPLIQQRADPDIFKHTDGYYYFTATIPSYDKIELRRATTIQGLATAAAIVIWTKHGSGIMGATTPLFQPSMAVRLTTRIAIRGFSS